MCGARITVMGVTTHEGLIDARGIDVRVEKQVVVRVWGVEVGIGEVTCRCKAGYMRVRHR